MVSLLAASKLEVFSLFISMFFIIIIVLLLTFSTDVVPITHCKMFLANSIESSLVLLNGLSFFGYCSLVIRLFYCFSDYCGGGGDGIFIKIPFWNLISFLIEKVAKTFFSKLSYIIIKIHLLNHFFKSFTT